MNYSPIFLTVAVWVLNCLAGLTRPAWAADVEPPGAQTPDLFMAGLKMAGGLIFLIGGLLLLAYLLRRFNLIRSGFSTRQDAIRVIATRSLAPKKYIALVEVGGNVLTLGITDQGISCLDKMTADVFEASLEKQHPQPSPGGFAGVMKSVSSPSGKEHSS